MKRSWLDFFAGMVLSVLLCMTISYVCDYFQFHPFDHSLATEIGDEVGVINSYIEGCYIGDIDREKLKEGALTGMVEALNDRYSYYIPKSEYSSVMSGIKGSYGGIGVIVKYSKKTGDITIDSLMKESAAREAGIRQGDILRKVDGKSVSGMSLEQVSALIKGEVGASLKIAVQRGSLLKEFTVVRAEVRSVSVKSRMEDSNIGFIQVTRFDDETPKQFKNALKKLEAEGEKGLIIDLRDNGGGSLTAVVDMLDRMLPKGTILTVKSKNEEDEVYKSTDQEQFSKPCVVLINGNSASASEVFAGAMQSRKAATLVGEKSFGKGIVQTIFSITDALDGAALKLTTAKYYLPNGKCIHGVGLTPDVSVEYTGSKEKYDIEKDNQLQKAKEVLNEKIMSKSE